MLRDLNELKNYRIQAIDGEMGAVHDFLFDDREWKVRYFVIDTGGWLPGRKVLISPVSVSRADWDAQRLRVQLTRDQVREAPAIHADPPVARQEEERLTAYYAWPAYWGTPAPMPREPATSQQRQQVAEQIEQAHSAQQHADPGLRSFREVTGYDIAATDGALGKVKNLLVDEADWVARYLVVDTQRWLPGKQVLIAPPWIDAVDWTRAQVKVSLTQEQVREAPAYAPDEPVTREYEERLHQHYGRAGHWESPG